MAFQSALASAVELCAISASRFSRIAAMRPSGEGNPFTSPVPIRTRKSWNAKTLQSVSPGAGIQRYHIGASLYSPDNLKPPSYSVDFEYLSQLFTDGEIESLHITVLDPRADARSPGKAIGQLSILLLRSGNRCVYLQFPAGRHPFKHGLSGAQKNRRNPSSRVAP
jgi:hypothetical protein